MNFHVLAWGVVRAQNALRMKEARPGLHRAEICELSGGVCAIVAWAGIVVAHALRRNKAEPLTKFRPSICVAH